MPIKSLESFLFESKLVSTSSIEILRNATIGIDVEHYLSRIYTYKKEQSLSGIGGVPTSLKQYIESDLSVFEEFNIRPIFILPGLKINTSQKTFKVNELSPQEQHLDATWARLYSKHGNSGGSSIGFTGESFRLKLEPLPINPMLNDIVKLFVEFDVDYMISPYDASFQLSYLYRSEAIDCIYGSTDVLLTSVDKFILGMEFQSKDFRFVDKKRILSELNLTERQFIDMSIMVGCSAQPETLPNFPPSPKFPSMSPFHQINYFRMAMDILFQYASATGPPADLYSYLKSLGDPNLIELYQKGISAIRFMPIMTFDGSIELFAVEMSRLGFGVHDDGLVAKKLVEDAKSGNNDEVGSGIPGMPVIPTDLHSVLSQRLPPEIYFYQSLGLIPMKLLEAITTGEYANRPALAVDDGYRSLVSSKRNQNLLDSQFNLITQLLARYYQVKRIKVTYWFQNAVIYLNNRLNISVSTRLRNAASCKMSSEDHGGPWSVFNEKLEIPGFQSSHQRDLISTSFRRALVLMQVMDDEGQFNGIGKTMKRFCEENAGTDLKMLEELLLLLLLIDTEGLTLVHPDDAFGKVSKGSVEGYESVDLSSEELSSIFLISRILATQRFDIHPINYQGPISRSLLVSRSHLKFFHELMQNSILASFIDLVVRNEEIKSRARLRHDWSDLIMQMPFYMDLNNTLLGVVSEMYYSSCVRGVKQGTTPAQVVVKSKNYLLDVVFQVGKLSHNINLSSVNSVTHDQFMLDFSQGLRFWSHFMLLMRISRETHPTMLSVSDFELVEKADKIVQKFSI